MERNEKANFDETDFTCHFPAHYATAKSREIRVYA